MARDEEAAHRAAAAEVLGPTSAVGCTGLQVFTNRQLQMQEAPPRAAPAPLAAADKVRGEAAGEREGEARVWISPVGRRRAPP